MKRPKIAAVVTEYRRYSHAQHILDRFLWGYGWDSRHHLPPMDLVAVYTDQTPPGELSRSRSRLFPQLKLYPTIAEALTRGGEKLAVDGVLLIGEHGDYPFNEKGQHLYPRYEFFREIVDVFRDSGRSAPVFNDKHLSWNWDWAKEMVDTSRELGFGFMAGSSLPVVPRLPSVDFPRGAKAEEALCIAVGGIDGYDIHALEAIQCLVERRRGGETGVVNIQALEGDAVWKAMRAGSWAAGGWDPALFNACLCRSHALTPVRQGFNHVLPTLDEIPALFEEMKQGKQKPVAYRYEHADGLKVTMLLLEGIVHDFTFAARLQDHRDPFSVLMYLPPREVCNFFSPLVNHMETLFLTGKSPYPVERTLLTTGITAAGVESLFRGQKLLKTPHLAIPYAPTEESTFWRS
jgi:hypothetical protein